MHKPNNKSLNRFDNFLAILARNEKKIYLYLALIILLLWISLALDIINLNKVLAFSIFVVIGGFFKYLISRFRIFVEFTPIAFFAVLTAQYIGLFWVIPYIFAADVVPSFLGRYGPDQSSIPHWAWVFLISIIALPFDITNIFARTLIPLIYFAGCLFIEQFLLGGLNGVKWASSLGNLAINFYFFINFTIFFVGIIY